MSNTSEVKKLVARKIASETGIAPLATLRNVEIIKKIINVKPVFKPTKLSASLGLIDRKKEYLNSENRIETFLNKPSEEFHLNLLKNYKRYISTIHKQFLIRKGYFDPIKQWI